MSFASKYNKVQGFGIDTKDFQFVKLADIYNSKDNGGDDVIHPVNGMWVTKSQLGFSPVIIDSVAKQLVNVPQHMTEQFNAILGDAGALQDIKDGKVGYTIYSYESHGRTCYSIRFVDIEK